MNRLPILGALLAVLFGGALSGCTPPVDAIVLSNDQLLIDRNTQPVNIQVWNANAGVPLLTVDVRASQSWILPSVSVITSTAPSGATLDKKTVKITIDRSTLPAGTYNEEATFSGHGLVSKSLQIRVIQDQDGSQGGDLNIVERGQSYESPSLISFNFRLEDKTGAAVIAEPAQFTVTGREGDTTVGSETGIYLRRAAARQFKAAVVMDYSQSMHGISGAIHGMEDAVKSDFLPALNNDALVALYEFHVESVPPNQVSGFTADHDLLINRINHIEDTYVNGFTGGSLAWDTLVKASADFGAGTSSSEDRYILLFSDGGDTSSAATVNSVIAAANSRGIHIYTIGFGANPNDADLEAIATGTQGAYYPAANVAQLQTSFAKIITDLQGQYVLRWATLKRADVQFLPAFTIGLGAANDTFTASSVFSVRAHAGNELRGKLRIVPSEDEVNSIAFLRADYVPRNVKRLRIFLESANTFSTTLVSPADDGLLGGWLKTETPEGNGTWIDLTAPAATAFIPFATFGPLLRFDFDGVVPDLAKPFDAVYIDDSIYANGQSFVVDGYDNVLPTN